MSPALATVSVRPDVFPASFRDYLAANEHVFEAFEAETQKVIEAGFRHYSARTIVHVLRHHSAIREKASAFKINNNASPYFARLHEMLHPEHVGLWEKRRTPKVDA